MWVSAHCTDDRVRRGQGRVDSCARCDCALRFLRMIEQLLRKLHCPWNVRDAPVQLAVNEVCAPPEKQSHRRCYDQIIAKIQPRNLVTARVIKREQQYPNYTAVTGHAPLPDTQDRQRLAQHVRLVEENVTETPANDYTEQGTTGDEIAYTFWRQIGVSALRQPEKQQIGSNECEHISQAIP